MSQNNKFYFSSFHLARDVLGYYPIPIYFYFFTYILCKTEINKFLMDISNILNDKYLYMYLIMFAIFIIFINIPVAQIFISLYDLLSRKIFKRYFYSYKHAYIDLFESKDEYSKHIVDEIKNIYYKTFSVNKKEKECIINESSNLRNIINQLLIWSSIYQTDLYSYYFRHISHVIIIEQLISSSILILIIAIVKLILNYNLVSLIIMIIVSVIITSCLFRIKYMIKNVVKQEIYIIRTAYKEMSAKK